MPFRLPYASLDFQNEKNLITEISTDQTEAFLKNNKFQFYKRTLKRNEGLLSAPNFVSIEYSIHGRLRKIYHVGYREIEHRTGFGGGILVTLFSFGNMMKKN